MSTLKTAFDPYREWLDVSVNDKPFDPYVLLGLEQLESNRLKIEAAINATRKRLKQVQPAAKPELFNEVESEIDRAVERLQDSKAKRLLDASILRKNKLRDALHGEILSAFENVQCASCASENGGDRRYCSKCGDCLWQICADCGEVGPVAESFCGSCGMNLEEALALKLSVARKSIAAAKALMEQCQIAEAMRAIEQLAMSDDPIVDEVIDDALVLLKS